MTKTEINNFRRALETRVIEFEQATRQRDAIQIEGSADAFDRRLQASAREFAVKRLEIETAKLREARAALQRIEEGTYGICVECEEPVSTLRLKALPWASLCIRCQETEDCRCGARSARPVLAMAA
jgi:RNA polymerase-binding transcription factor